MSLQQAIEDLKKQIAENEKEEEVVEEVAEAEAEEPEVEEEQKEEAKEEPKVEEKVEVKEELDSAGYARLRREAAAERKRREALEAEIEELRAAKNQPEQEESAIPKELEEVVMSHRQTQAEKEFMALEANFARRAPDYHDISAQYADVVAQSIRALNPRFTPVEIAEATKKTILTKASAYVQKGLDPIEELYYEAKELGISKREVKAVEKEEEIKPDLNKVAKNRQRSAGMASSNGRAEGQMTPSAAAELSVRDWARLTPSQKEAIFAQLAS